MEAADIRTKFLRRYFGDGIGGTVATSLITWGLARVAEGFRHEEEVIDVSRLHPGETYKIVTRPAPTRAERKLAVRSAKASERMHKATRPGPAERRMARQIERLQRKIAKAPEDSAKRVKLLAESGVHEARYARATARTPRQRLFVERAEEAQRDYEAARAASLAQARRSARPPRRRIWHAR